MSDDPRDSFDLTPQQYHAGLDKLWNALDVTGVQKDDVFTMASKEIQSLKQTVRELAESIVDIDDCCCYDINSRKKKCTIHECLKNPTVQRIMQEGK